MVRTTFLMASLFVLVGLVFTLLTHTSHAAIPAGIGALLAICGAIVASKPALRKHVMHVAMLLALLAFFGMIYPPMIKAIQLHDRIMFSEIVLTMGLCVLYVLLGVRSFIAARRDSKAAAIESTDSDS